MAQFFSPALLRAFGVEATKLADVKTPLLPHQKRVVDRMKDETQPGLVVAHGLGSGKTLTAIAAQDALQLPTTVVVPAALRANYEKEQEKHLLGKRAPTEIASLEGVARKGELPDAPMLIVDEAHRARDPGTKTLRALHANQAEKRMLLTASPFYNHPADLAPLINLAAGQPVLPEDRQLFERKFVAQEQVRPSFKDALLGVRPGYRPRLAAGAKSHLRDVFGKWVDYHPGSQDEFPRVVRQDVPVEMSPEQVAVYDTLMGHAPAWVARKIRSGLPPDKQESKQLNAFLTAVRQATTSTRPFGDKKHEPKVDKAFDELKRVLNENPEARGVVYSNFLDAGIAPYRERLEQAKIPFGEFTGDVSRTARDQMVRDYNEGKIRALLLSSAGGEGLDLKGTRILQVLEPHWNSEKLKQVEGRGVRYKSHAHLPEADREVLIQRYLAQRPRQSLLERWKLVDPGLSVDEYLARLSGDKEQLHDQFRSILAEQNKTAAAEQGVATKTDPELWERMKERAREKMGGKHSARAMQLAAKMYQDAGGGYSGKKPSAAANKMVKWTKQKWQTRPGTPEVAEREDGRTARYLPKKKWESLDKDEQRATDRKKLRATDQFVDNTPEAKVHGDAKYHD